MVGGRILSTGCILYFSHGLEFEVWVDMPRPVACWSTVGGAPLGFAKWGTSKIFMPPA